MKVRLELHSVLVLVDTRELTPLDHAPLSTKSATLTAGDYTAVGLENVLVIERRSLDDLLGCSGAIVNDLIAKFNGCLPAPFAYCSWNRRGLKLRWVNGGTS